MNFLPTIKLMNDFTYVLTQMERTGIKIDLRSLEELRIEYEHKHQALEKQLDVLIRSVTNGQPVNYNSPEQMSRLIYSREVDDKQTWQRMFNIGTEFKNGVKKKKRIAMYGTDFKIIVDKLSKVCYIKDVKKCSNSWCKNGRVLTKKNKDGSWSKVQPKCPVCDGTQLEYFNTDEVYGFQIKPHNQDVADGGFSTSKKVLERLAESAKGKAKEFLLTLMEYHAVNSYLGSYIGGIQRGTDVDSSILHPSFMQFVTATGRLSSRDPNFQNLPKRGNFPLRRVVVSRFPGGLIGEADFSQLEFRVAAELSGSEVALTDIVNKVDVHRLTCEVIHGEFNKKLRDLVKPHTFKPLYGGTSGTDRERAYYKAFLEKYGFATWQRELQEEALSTGCVTLPTGRAYKFPYIKRMQDGNVTGSTQIKNYPVQGYATADIVPAVLIEVYWEMKRRNLQSVLINTVHDSIVFDIYPGEEDAIASVLRVTMGRTHDIMLKRYGITMVVPIDYEFSIGRNWLTMKEYVNA